MTRAAILAGAAAILLVTADAFAQERPNFAGQWTLIVDANAPAPAAGGRGGGRGGMMGGGLGQQATITQDANQLVITRTTQMGEIRSTYNLDGSPSRNTLAMAGQSVDQVSRVRWDGGKLVITTSIDMAGNAIETSMALSLDASGVLVLESTSPGFGGAGGGTTTTRYQKGS